MFQKKPIYIVGIVLFTLLLILDLVAYFTVPAGGGRGQMPGFGGGDFNFEDMGGQVPDMGDFDFGDFDFEGMGGFGGQMGGFGGQMGGAQSGGLMSTIRSGFWPILIICVLGDALCIYMLIRIRRKEEENEELSESEEDLRRQKRVNIGLGAVAAVLVIAVTVTSLPSGDTGGGMEAEMSIEQAAAELTDIVSVFSGSGTLQSSQAAEMEIPAGVRILSFAVETGDTVEAGDVIAYVDKTSVQKTVYEVQALLDRLDAELAQVSASTYDDTVVSQAEGRVKAIYVAAGDSVTGVMKEKGALILISLGGSMTVVTESSAKVSVGQSVTVTLSDGTQVEGKVQQAGDGTITVTTTDDGPIPGDTVSVETEDGVALGSGILEVSSPLNITGYYGTVSTLEVAVGDTVQIGDTLLTLADTRDVAQYQQLLRQREALTDAIAELSRLYGDGCILAGIGGIVSQLGQTASAAEGGSFGSQPGQEASYTVEMSALCTITPAETMTIDISVDELDILSLTAGQEASITLDALPGQSFTGVVRKINTTGTNDGGSTKYTVTMEVAKQAKMLAGMNASVRIEVSKAENILTVPAAAVYEDGNRCYVYTALDKNGEPANPVEVVTGSSDGQVIEILEGLSSGDTVYYSYADSIVFRASR